MSKNKKKTYFNRMSTRILTAVVVGMLSIAALVIFTMVKMSENVFVDVYGESQEQVFEQIASDLNEFHENLMKIMTAVDNSWAFRLYFGSEEALDSVTSFQTVYEMKKDLEQAIPSNVDDIVVMVLNEDGASYINREENIVTPVEEILDHEITQKAYSDTGNIHYFYLDQGFTSTTREESAVIGVKALTRGVDKEPYGAVYITMKSSDFRKLYGYFTTEYTDFFMTAEDGTIIAANREEYEGLNQAESPLNGVRQQPVDNLDDLTVTRGDRMTVLYQDMPYYEGEIFGVIDNDKALDSKYNVLNIVAICVIGVGAVIILIFLIIRQTTRPLSNMAVKMKAEGIGKFQEPIQVSGPEEVRIVATAYNSMLEDLNRYINQLMETQKEKRKAEIRALQMQINPHYIYNTLAGIKWLIWQGDAKKSTETIDAFIALLRNTISNTSEFIPVEQEIQNLKNYVLINNVRYGERVRVEFFVADGYETCLLPKLILQPFIENAFFHAFPADRLGTIQVVIGRKKDMLRIEIADDGIGMTEERRKELMRKDGKSRKEEHFSGIGINNVDDRLKLLYGQEYGVHIASRENEGTTITLLLPITQEERR